MKSILSFLTLIICLHPLFAQNLQEEGKNKLNIYAILSSEGEGIVKNVSHLMDQNGLTSFEQQGKKIHVTLYLADFKEYSTYGIQYRVQMITQNWNPFPASFSGFSQTKSHWLFIDLAENELLQDLTDHIVLDTKEFRLKGETPPQWLKDYPEKVKAFERYGSPNVFQNFDPHVTLLAEGDAAKIDQFLKNPEIKNLEMKQNFKIIGIGIAKVDQWGQIEGSPLVEFPLKYVYHPVPPTH